VQIGHGCEVVDEVNRQADLDETVPPWPDRKVLTGNRAAKRFRVLLSIKIHEVPKSKWPANEAGADQLGPRDILQ
jgi:hypothetical protein